jgi:hypothetical protein
MIADQEKINGCVRFAFQLSPFLKLGLSKVDIYFYVDMFTKNMHTDLQISSCWEHIST